MGLEERWSAKGQNGEKQRPKGDCYIPWLMAPSPFFKGSTAGASEPSLTLTFCLHLPSSKEPQNYTALTYIIQNYLPYFKSPNVTTSGAVLSWKVTSPGLGYQDMDIFGKLWFYLPHFFFFFLAVTGLSWHMGSSLHHVVSLLCHMDSLVAAHGLGACGLSCSAACGILVPRPGIEPASPAL